jgi:hypothetical protein
MRARQLLGWVVAACLLGDGLAQAQATQEEGAVPAVSTTASVEILSNFVWRGVRLSEGWVIQPSASLDSRGLSLNLWGNVDLSEYPLGSGHSGGRLTEVDVTGSYTRAFGRTSVTAGFIQYAVRDFEDTTELFATLTLAAPLSPSLSGYYDMDQGDGGFLIISLGQQVRLTPAVPLELGGYATMNFKNKVMGVGANGAPFTGLYSAEVNAALAFSLGPRLTLTPRVAYAFPLSDNGKAGLRSASYGGATHQRLYAGLNATATW